MQIRQSIALSFGYVFIVSSIPTGKFINELEQVYDRYKMYNENLSLTDLCVMNALDHAASIMNQGLGDKNADSLAGHVFDVLKIRELMNLMSKLRYALKLSQKGGSGKPI